MYKKWKRMRTAFGHCVTNLKDRKNKTSRVPTTALTAQASVPDKNTENRHFNPISDILPFRVVV
jgi:hypothetical protein